MQSEFQGGDLVANKANPKVPFTFLHMQNDNVNAALLNANGEKVFLPVVALTKYDSPKGPTIRDISNMW